MTESEATYLYPFSLNYFFTPTVFVHIYHNILQISSSHILERKIIFDYLSVRNTMQQLEGLKFSTALVLIMGAIQQNFHQKVNADNHCYQQNKL